MLGRQISGSVLLLTLAALCANAAVAQSDDASATQRPAYAVLRDEENWQYLRDPSRRTDAFDSLKYVSVGAHQRAYATFGAELREFYEHYFNQNWLPNGSNGYVLQRYLLDADVHAGRARAFVEFESAIDPGRKGGPGINDQNEFDPTEAFVQWSVGGPAATFEPPLAVQAGRFELNYGAGRILAANDGPGVRNAFDGVRAIVRAGGWRTDAFAFHNVAVRPAIFDDATDRDASLFGVYAARTRNASATLEAYALGDDRTSVAYQKGRSHETRYTVGSRIGRTWHRFDSEAEAAYQFGTFGAGNISAFALAGGVGYTLAGRHFVTRLSWQGGIGSGDHDPNGTSLGAFRPPTFKGQYFGAIAANGPINSVGSEPGVTTTYDGKIIAAATYLIFERQSRADGVYGIGANLLVDGTTARSAALGSGPLVSLAYRIDAHSTLQTIYQHYLAGPFLQSSPPNDNSIGYYRAVLDYKL